MTDPIVEEVRKTRDAHARRFNYNLNAIYADFKSHQKKCGHPLVNLSPKKLTPKLILTDRKKLQSDFTGK